MFGRLLLLVAAIKVSLEEHVLVAGTCQNLSNLLFLDIYGLSLSSPAKCDQIRGRLVEQKAILSFNFEGDQIHNIYVFGHNFLGYLSQNYILNKPTYAKHPQRQLRPVR